jgi:ATP-dependent protease ClpP protease subunit
MSVRVRMAADGARIDMHGEVGWEITPPAVVRALREAGAAPVTVSINSYGGSAFDGIAIHNLLARHAAPVTVVIEAIAASAASVIAMAGQRIVMPGNALMMIHRAAALAYGNGDDARSTVEMLDRVDRAAAETYAARTGLSVEEILELMDAETWFSAEEAVARGFATEAAAPAEIVLSIDRLAAFRNPPPSLLRLSPAAASAASPPADPAAFQESARMTERLAAADPAAPTLAAATDPAAPTLAAAALLAAPATLAQLEALAERGGLGAEWTLAQLRAGATMAAATDAALDAAVLAGRAAATTARVAAAAAAAPDLSGVGRVQVTRDERETRVDLMVNALLHQHRPDRVKLDDGARQFRGLSLVDLARECLENAGVRTRGLGRYEIAQAALAGPGQVRLAGGEHTISDFPRILANTANKSLRAAYLEAAQTFRVWARQQNLPDYKSFNVAALSAAPRLLPVPESGEIEFGSFGEENEAWALARYGRIAAISALAIINDDLGAFTRIPAAWGAAASGLESDIVYFQLLQNALLTTGFALFSTQHANLLTGTNTALTPDAAGVNAVGLAEEALGIQTDPSGAILGQVGRTLLVPTALATEAGQLFSSATVPGTIGQANPFIGRYQVVAEARLQRGVTLGATTVAGSAAFWYLLADAGDTIAYGGLDGADGPQVSSAVDFDTDGVKVKVVHSFGAKAISHRHMVRANGA